MNDSGKMDPEWKDKWLEALRSGRYKQGRGRLRADDCYCCLGVLCDVVDPKPWKPMDDDVRGAGVYKYSTDFGEDYGVGYPPETVQDLVGLPHQAMMDLARLNDTLERTFDQIADYVERDL